MTKERVSKIETGAESGGLRMKGDVPFSAHIVYVQPEFEELRHRFPGCVDPRYKSHRLDPIERYKSVSTESREVTFEYIYMKRDVSTDEVFAEMDCKSLRPALYEELLGFALKYPDEQREFPIVALGSEVRLRAGCHVAYLWYDGDGRHLRMFCLDRDWYVIYRFLAVRE